MTDNKFFSLSQYQQAMLTHMGITPWQLKSNQQENRKPNPVPSSPQAALAVTDSVPSLEQKQQGLAKLKQQISSNKIDAKGAIIVFASEEHEETSLMKDLLMWLANDKAIIFAKDDQELSQFKNYALVWQISDIITSNDKHLETPSLEQLKRPEVKKQLWKALSANS